MFFTETPIDCETAPLEQTYLAARAEQMERHRAWALRLFALAIGSWMYRMDYGFWVMLTGGAGHTPQFDGWFDAVIIFFFYVANFLLVRSIYSRTKTGDESAVKTGSGEHFDRRD